MTNKLGNYMQARFTKKLSWWETVNDNIKKFVRLKEQNDISIMYSFIEERFIIEIFFAKCFYCLLWKKLRRVDYLTSIVIPKEEVMLGERAYENRSFIFFETMNGCDKWNTQ